jgi:carbon storage regulator CsrA
MTKLVITRKAGQSVNLFDENDVEVAEITVLKLERNQVRLLYSAPLSTKINRGEKLSDKKSEFFVDI